MPIVDRAITAVLTHPVALALKRPARDLWWNIRGPGVKNPPLPPRVESILFVCLGNICRSPFAGLIAAQQWAARPGNVPMRCASAGIRTTQAGRSPSEACDVAAEYGVSLRDHRPQMLTRELMAAHDVVVVMEVSQLAELKAAYPEAADRLFLMSLFEPGPRTGYDRYNIADPFSQPRAAYEHCYRRINIAVSGLIAAVSSLSR